MVFQQRSCISDRFKQKPTSSDQMSPQMSRTTEEMSISKSLVEIFNLSVELISLKVVLLSFTAPPRHMTHTFLLYVTACVVVEALQQLLNLALGSDT